jgi:DNA primase
VFILFDNDSAGLEDGRKLAEQTGFINLVLPKFEGGKDVSDLYKTVGKEKFVQTINTLFADYKDDDLPF